ncbi:uncharacterized protein DUF3945 [Spirosoma oryzae]|uniref:Uncharacterized protein DUF3945 n=1 Tax=Spirosoma oryzae TaxID=1469603 RepID=A0A2T0S3B2_9BACT|nr:toprim domain-containing protein [Spirosoma oryzae]PRY27803.1 uncharacterized protein DUF3945 [Spirosoma oryzae]
MTNNTPQQNRDLITRYKTDISLVAYLDSVGFTADKAHYSRKWPVMKDDVTGRKLIVGRNQATSEYFYYNPNDSNDRGSIIELLAERLNLDLRQKSDWDTLHQEGSRLTGNVYLSNHDHVLPQPIRSHTRESAIGTYFKLDELKNTQFLEHDRRLSPETIMAPEFERKIFNKSFIDKTLDIAGKNTTFPIENREGIIGVINRNPTWNQIQGSKDDGVWLSNILPNQPVRELLVTEAPIDALSFHELNKPAVPGERLYVSTAGNVTSSQPTTIQYLIDQTKPQLLLLGMDNDLPGIRYNINLMGKLHMPGQPDTGIDVHVNNSQHTNRVIIGIDHQKAIGQGGGTSIESIVQRIGEVMNRGFPSEAPKAGINIISQRSNYTTVEVAFPNIRPLLIRAENLTAELRQTGDKIQVRRAIENDFNEDLQLKSVKQQLHQQTDVKLNSEQLKNLISSGRTAIVLHNQYNAGKVIIDHSKAGPSLQFVERQKELNLPVTFNGYTLTAADRQQLRSTGLLDHRIEIIHPLSNQPMRGFLGVDAELNQLTFLPAERLKTRNLYNVKLDEQQTRDVLQGKTIDVTKLKDGETSEFRVRIDLIRGEIGVVPIRPPLQSAQSVTEQTNVSQPRKISRQEKSIQAQNSSQPNAEKTDKLTNKSTAVSEQSTKTTPPKASPRKLNT